MFKKKPRLPSLRKMKGKLREFILDTQLEDPHTLSVAMGCAPISEEVAEREEEESDKRLEKISHLIPLLYAYSHVVADGTSDIQRSSIKLSEELPEEVWNYNRQLVEQLSFAVLVGSVSQMVDMGLLKINTQRKK